ncbi:hypothetical protein [Pseudophaeobacter sp. EL27]|uniref:hypothetical protein n=1 Tax=Pseudophaeobacter sp. EL27 TaxID=2107580 RepID=UPI000EFC4310|nr:hypothetical protein [Pseudophaeobacter sp. EL27]
MFKTIFRLAIVAMSLSACSGVDHSDIGGPSSAEIRAQKAENLALWETRQSISYAGKPFEIAVASSKAFAFIAPGSDGFSYTPTDLEAAARSFTGCQAKYAAGILTMVGGYSASSDLRSIQSKVKSFKYWRTDLTC